MRIILKFIFRLFLLFNISFIQLNSLCAESPEHESSIARDLSFYASFNDGYNADYHLGMAAGKPKEKDGFTISTVAAKYGKGLLVSMAEKNSPPQFSAAGNILHSRGTIAMWIKPVDDVLASEEIKNTTKFVFSASGIKVFLHKGKVKFWTYSKEGKEGRNDSYEPQAKIILDKDSWMHIVISWKEATQEKKIYINGKNMTSSSANNSLPENSFSDNAASFVLGSSPGQAKHLNLNAIFDEMYIWKRVLTEEEISAVYQGKMPSIRQPGKSVGQAAFPDIQIEYAEKNMADGIYYIGSNIVITTPIQNTGSQTLVAELEYNLLDYYESLRQKKSRTITLQPGTRQNDIQSWQPGAYGVYKVKIIVRSGNNIRKKDIATFAVIPTALSERTADENAFYGSHPKFIGVNVGSGYLLDIEKDIYHLEIAGKLGLKQVRNLDFIQATYWYRVQEKPEAFDFEKSDYILRELSRKGLSLMGMMYATPLWAQIPGRHKNKYFSTGSPRNMNDWENYIKTVAQRYKGKIKSYEIWNEPDCGPSHFDGTPEEYVKMLQIAYQTIKTVDPSIEVVGGGGLHWQVLQNFPTEIFKLGALKYMDSLSVHWKTKPGEDVMEGLSWFRDFKALMKKYGEEKPIINSEGGIWSATYYSDLDFNELPPTDNRDPAYTQYQEGANTFVKALSIMQSEGVKRYYSYWLRGDGNMRNKANADLIYFSDNLLDWGNAPFTHSPKPMAIAYAFHAYIFAKMKFNKRLTINDVLWCFTYSDDKKSAATLWAQTEKSNEINISLNLPVAQTQIYNLMLGSRQVKTRESDALLLSLSSEPVYLIYQGSCADIEKAFINLHADKDISAPLAIDELSLVMKNIKGFALAREARESDWRIIDIRAFCNMCFLDNEAADGKGGWTDEGPLNNMDGIKLGKRQEYQIPFEIIDPQKNNDKSCMVLQSTKTSPRLPQAIENIPINDSVYFIYFIHAAGWAGKETEPYAKYIINYEDNSRVEIPLAINKNCADWWKPPLPDEEGRPVLERVKSTATPGNKNNARFFRVFEWENKKREYKIKSIDFVSLNKQPIPILLGITIRR